MEITIKNRATTPPTWIRISEGSEGGHYYEMFNVDPELDENEEAEDIDGGLCTGTDVDALTMALSQAGFIYSDHKFKSTCEDCGADSPEHNDPNTNPTCPDCGSDNIMMVLKD